MRIELPDVALVLLVGPSGAGKSTFARQYFRPEQVISSDHFRAIVSDDESDQSASVDAFELMHAVCEKRLRRELFTVIDATNLKADARKPYITMAQQHGVKLVAIVFQLPQELCVQRSQTREGRTVTADVVDRHVVQLPNTLKCLENEGFYQVHVLNSTEEVASVQIHIAKPSFIRRDWQGAFDIIGDVHGCREELLELLSKLGCQRELVTDHDGRPVWDVVPAPGRRLLFVGDLVDRGPDTPGVIRLVQRLIEQQRGLCVRGNHDDKLYRKLLGRSVRVTEGLERSLTQIAQEPPEFVPRAAEFLSKLPLHYVLDDGRLVIAHAGIQEKDHGRSNERIKAFCLYGDTTGEKDEHGMPVRRNWAENYQGAATVVYGHTPIRQAQWLNRTINIDTGCVFGHMLTALRYPEGELISVPARQKYIEPGRPIE